MLEVYRCWVPRVKATLCYSNTRGRGEQGEDNKKRGERRQGAATNAWEDHDTGSKSQSGSNFCDGGFIDMWLVDKKKWR